MCLGLCCKQSLPFLDACPKEATGTCGISAACTETEMAMARWWGVPSRRGQTVTDLEVKVSLEPCVAGASWAISIRLVPQVACARHTARLVGRVGSQAGVWAYSRALRTWGHGCHLSTRPSLTGLDRAVSSLAEFCHIREEGTGMAAMLGQRAPRSDSNCRRQPEWTGPWLCGTLHLACVDCSFLWLTFLSLKGKILSMFCRESGTFGGTKIWFQVANRLPVRSLFLPLYKGAVGTRLHCHEGNTGVPWALRTGPGARRTLLSPRQHPENRQLAKRALRGSTAISLFLWVSDSRALCSGWAASLVHLA